MNRSRLFLIAAWVVVFGATIASAQPDSGTPPNQVIERFAKLKERVEKTISTESISDRRKYYGSLKDYRLKLIRLSPRLKNELDRIKTELAARQNEISDLETKARKILEDQGIEDVPADQLQKKIDAEILPALNDQHKRKKEERDKARHDYAVAQGALKAATSQADTARLEKEYNSARDQYFRTRLETFRLSRQINDIKSIATVRKQIEQKIAAVANLRSERAGLESSSDDLAYLLSVLDDRVQSLLSEDDRKSYYTTISTGIFAVLVGLVIFGFFAIAFLSEPVRNAIFAGDSGIQFVTMFSLVIAIILFGILGILQGKELAALLGGLSGYILGRGSTTPNTPPPRRGGLVQNSNQPPEGPTSQPA